MADPVTVTARIFFQGLLLFVPHGDSAPGQLDVLLPDARRPPVASDGCPIQPHDPWLLFSVDRRDQCPEDHCELYLGVCRCALDRVEIDLPQCDSLRIEPPAIATFQSAVAEVPKLPVTNLYRSDSYVPNGAERGRARRDCRPNCGPSPHGSSPLVVANLHLIVDQGAAVCDDPARPTFEFKPAGEPRYFQPVKKKGVDRLVTRATLRSKDDAGAAVVIRFRALDDMGGFTVEAPAFECPFDPEMRCIDLAIVNDPDFDHFPVQGGRCSPSYIGRHFELLYDLMTWPRSQEERPIPHDLRGDGRPTVSDNAHQSYTAGGAGQHDHGMAVAELPCDPSSLCCRSRLEPALGAHAHRKAEQKPLCSSGSGTS